MAATPEGVRRGPRARRGGARSDPARHPLLTVTVTPRAYRTRPHRHCQMIISAAGWPVRTYRWNAPAAARHSDRPAVRLRANQLLSQNSNGVADHETSSQGTDCHLPVTSQSGMRTARTCARIRVRTIPAIRVRARGRGSARGIRASLDRRIVCGENHEYARFIHPHFIRMECFIRQRARFGVMLPT